MTPIRHFNIEGIWLINGKTLDESCILVIMEDGRTIQFPNSETRPGLNRTMRLWHSEYTGSQIRFRPSPTAEGWLRGVEPAENSWTLIAQQDESPIHFQCTPLATEDLPNWYEERLTKNLACMKKTELNEL